MKTELAKKYKFVIGFVVMVVIFWGCKSDINDLGKDLLFPGDLVNVRNHSEKNIMAYTFTDGNQRTDEAGFNLLGTFNDPLFGKTTADFACQFRLSGYPDSLKTTSIKPQIDSLVLSLVYREVYGDTLTSQHFKVYELGSDLDIDQKYYQNTDLKSMSKAELVGEKNYTPKFKLDSLTADYGSTKAIPKDTTIQEIRIKLNQHLLDKLMAADSLTWSDNDKFIKYFKGLYIEADDLTQGGSILKVNTLGNGSRIAIHYHTSTNDSLIYIYNINSSSARVNRFAHDYSKTAFAAHLDKTDVQDSLIYLQASGGLRTKILIPDLGTWKDSTNIAINRAELIFQVDSTVTDLTKLLPPEQLIFSAIGVDDKGNEIKYFPKDLTFSTLYYNGTYNSKDKTYRFNIANHMQQVIDKVKGKENLGFYLATSQPSSTFRRVVLKGVTSKTGIRFEVAYSKIK